MSMVPTLVSLAPASTPNSTDGCTEQPPRHVPAEHQPCSQALLGPLSGG